jgi:hypothetical protein
MLSVIERLDYYDWMQISVYQLLTHLALYFIINEISTLNYGARKSYFVFGN